MLAGPRTSLSATTSTSNRSSPRTTTSASPTRTLREGFARVDQRFAEFETMLTNRLFVFWVAQAATTVGLVFGVVKVLTP